MAKNIGNVQFVTQMYSVLKKSSHIGCEYKLKVPAQKITH